VEMWTSPAYHSRSRQQALHRPMLVRGRAHFYHGWVEGGDLARESYVPHRAGINEPYFRAVGSECAVRLGTELEGLAVLTVVSPEGVAWARVRRFVLLPRQELSRIALLELPHRRSALLGQAEEAPRQVFSDSSVVARCAPSAAAVAARGLARVADRGCVLASG
jgi:hypothetical protein